LSIFGPMFVLAGWLSWKYYEPEEKRTVRLAISIYLFLGIGITASGVIQRFAPDPDAGVVVTAPAPTTAEAGGAKKTKEQRAAVRKAEREKALAEAREKNEKELRVLTAGTYWDAVKLRGGEFPKKAANDFGFGIVLIGMFLLGTWFVRSGVMENTGAHLDFFRKLAMYGLPVGIGLGLLSSAIAMSHTMGDQHDGWAIASGMQIIGNLPACLGYVGMIVLMLHSKTALSRVRVLGPAGRMALTNYLTQSLICATYFYGYAMGHWGMPRAQQVLFVAIVYSAQVVFSHLWLSKFQYGPMEWLWRAFTYWQVPKLVRSPQSRAAARAEI